MVKKICKYAFLALVLLFIYIPIFVLVFFSFTDTKVLGDWGGFSFGLYRKLFTNSHLMTIIGNTVLLAVGAGLISTVLGTLGAIGIFYSKKRTKAALGFLNNIPVVNAEIVTALSLALLFAMLSGLSIGLSKTYFSLVVAHVVITAPFVILSVTPKLKQMDKNIYEAALDLGASPLRAMMTIIIPEILPGILSGFMLSVTLSLDDYIVTAFTKPNGFDTISTYVYNAVKVPVNSQVNELRALSTIIFLIIIVVAVLMNIRKKEAVK